MQNYIVKKSQRIVSAIYFITDSIKDSDFLKWEIREEAIHFVSNTLGLSSHVPVEKDYAYKTIVSSTEKLISLITVAKLSLIISKMNSSIVINEINMLVEQVTKDNRVESELSGYILSDSFFATDSPSVGDKGQNMDRNPNKTASNKVSDIKMIKKDRRESIIDLLKKDSNLTIKDFSKVIKDCSEKTIQRELTGLVEKGLVKKVGERRWSTYSLIII